MDKKDLEAQKAQEEFSKARIEELETAKRIRRKVVLTPLSEEEKLAYAKNVATTGKPSIAEPVAANKQQKSAKQLDSKSLKGKKPTPEEISFIRKRLTEEEKKQWGEDILNHFKNN